MITNTFNHVFIFFLGQSNQSERIKIMIISVHPSDRQIKEKKDKHSIHKK